LIAEVSPYIRSDRPVVDASETVFSESIQSGVRLSITLGNVHVSVLDRRLVGMDWLTPPEENEPVCPRFAFMSFKGGVGRSTALSIAAAHLANQGRNVLVVDLDLEAPGLGAMLLDEKTLPRFGMIDGLVENNFGKLSREFLADMVGPSSLAQQGRIDVVPAFGRESLQNPGEILSKLARAYVDDIREEKILSMRDQVRELIADLEGASRYDAVLVDARAGLNESTAASLLGLSANVYLFGLNERQTFQGYAALLAHLRRLTYPGRPSAWLDRFFVVQAKAGDHADQREFKERWSELLRKSWIQEASASNVVSLPAEPFGDVPWDETPVSVEKNEFAEFGVPVAILQDTRFVNFDPFARRTLIAQNEYWPVYSQFLAELQLRVDGVRGK